MRATMFSVLALLTAALLTCGCGPNPADDDDATVCFPGEPCPDDDSADDDAHSSCGDGACDVHPECWAMQTEEPACAYEDCFTCPEDCACAEGDTCTGGPWVPTSCEPTNPLIATLPGWWHRENDDWYPDNRHQITVDALNPTCYSPDPAGPAHYSGGERGDACVVGLQPVGLISLSGYSLFLHFGGYIATGEVAEDGNHLSFTSGYDDGTGGTLHSYVRIVE